MKKSKEEIEKLVEEKYGKNSAHPMFKEFIEGYITCQESKESTALTKEEFIKTVSKIDTTGEDEFKAKYNSPELLWKYLKSLNQKP